MEQRVALLVALLLAASLAPVIQAQAGTDGSTSTPAVLQIRPVLSPGSFDLQPSGPTWNPGETVQFEIGVRNPSDHPINVTVGDPPLDFGIRDVFGSRVTNASVSPVVQPGQTLHLEAHGGHAKVADVEWDPADHFATWGTVVVYYAAEAHMDLAGGARLTDHQPFQVERADLRVDAYGQFPGTTLPTFSGMDVPVTLKNVGDDAIAGAFRFTVRDGPDAAPLYRSGDRAKVTLQPGDTVDATWTPGGEIGSGTYLVRAILAGNGTRWVDEFPVELHAGPQVVPVPTVTTDQARYDTGDRARFNVTLRNPNSDAMTLEFPSGQEFDILLRRPDGTTLRWSDDAAFDQSFHRRTVPAGGTLTWHANMTVDQSGAYEAVGVVPTSNHGRLKSIPHPFFVGPGSGLDEPRRTCTGAESTRLSISLTDAQGASRAAFRPGQAVHVNLVNTADVAYEGGAVMRITTLDGRVLTEDRLPDDRRLHPDRAWTFVWDQTGPDGDPVANGSYVAEVSARDGRVAMEFDVGDPTGSSGSSSGVIAGTTCSYEVPGYYHVLDVTTDKVRYDRGETVRIDYGADQPLKGEVTLSILDASRRAVFETTVRLNTTLDADETATFTWDQTRTDGTQVRDGFYVVRVQAAGLSGESPLLVGEVTGLARPEQGYDVVKPTTPHHVTAWDQASIDGVVETYGHQYVTWFTRVSDARRSALDAAKARGLHGAIQYDGSLAEGTYVTFNFDESTGRITAYSIAPGGESPTTMFTSVAPRPYQGLQSGTTVEGLSVTNPMVAGPLFAHLAEAGMINVHDAPRGTLMVRTAEDKQVDFTLAEGFTASRSDDGNCVDVRGPLDGSVCVLGDGEVRVTDNVVSVQLAAGSQLMAFAQPTGARSTLVDRGIAEGRVGAEVSVVDSDASQPVVYTPGFRRIETNPVTEDGRTVGVNVVVDKATPEGTVLVFKVDKSVVNASSPRDVLVELDGEEIPRASSLRSVLNPADTSEARYVVILGQDDILEVAAYVPHFSERTVTIQSVAEALEDPAIRQAVIQGALVAAVVTLAAAVAVFRKPDR